MLPWEISEISSAKSSCCIFPWLSLVTQFYGAQSFLSPFPCPVPTWLQEQILSPSETVNEAEWRGQLFSISVYSHPYVGVVGLIYCLTPVLNTEQTCIIPGKLLCVYKQVLWQMRTGKLGQLLRVGMKQRAALRHCWALSPSVTGDGFYHLIQLYQKAGLGSGWRCLLVFFHQASANSSSVQVSSTLELWVCSGRDRTLCPDPVDFHMCSSPLENLTMLHLSHCWGLSERAAGGGGSSTCYFFSEALWITVGMLWNLGMMLQELGGCGWSNSATKLCCPYSLKMSLGVRLALCSLSNEFRLGRP